MNKLLKTLTFSVLYLFLLITPVADARFLEVDDTKELNFPEAHGAHPDYKIEWWYFVGHLKSEQKESFGYELTFFRVGNEQRIESDSNWNLDSFYLAHFAITDDQNKKFYHGEKTTRPNFGQAGAKENHLEVWIQDWKVLMDNQGIHLQASLENVALNLNLSPDKEVVLHGDDGFSKKGPELGEASYYSSFTRLNGNGQLSIDDQVYAIDEVTGWMDHEVTSQDLPEGIIGWDWFAIQLDNHEEIMVYQLRKKDGGKSTFSKGSFISKEGKLSSLKHDDYSIRSLSKWKSPKTQITYPSAWEIDIPKLNYKLKVVPTVKEQELTTEQSTNITYWEGRCLVEKTTSDSVVTSGVAYVELTGYGQHLEYF
jgi:predicted secreted hydrolase